MLYGPSVPSQCVTVTVPFTRPKVGPTASFAEVLERRRSGIGHSVSWQRIADLLWFAAGVRGSCEAGRAGLPVQWSACPSAGGLGCLHIICVSENSSRPRLYDPVGHCLIELDVDPLVVTAANRQVVEAVTGAYRGCTLRLVADWAKLSAAYINAESLLFRDAGSLTATLGLTAAWLDLTACPLGFVGDNLVPRLGFPSDRFRAAGAVQIGDMN